MRFVYLYTSIIFNLLTNVGFKLSALNDATPVKKWSYFIGGLFFGLLNSWFFTESLKDIPLGIASAIFFSLTILGLVASAYFLFSEKMNLLQLSGMLVIVIGVVMVSLDNEGLKKLTSFLNF